MVLFLALMSLVWYFNQPTGLFQIGNYFFGGGAYDLNIAQKMYEKVLTKDSVFPGANYQLGRVYFIKGDFSASWYYIDKEIKYYPDFAKSYYMRGLIFGYANHLDAAEKDFLEFLSRKPNSWAGYNDLAWVYFKKGDYSRMEFASRKGLEFSGMNPWLLNALGLAIFNQDREDEAKNYFAASIMRFEAIGKSGWGKAYPGNSPNDYQSGYDTTLNVVRDNLLKANKGDKKMQLVDNHPSE